MNEEHDKVVLSIGMLEINRKCLGIDASNIRAGGGITHLVEVLNAAQPEAYDFEKVLVWGGTKTLDRLPEKPWLQKVSDPLLDRALPFRLYWQRFKLAQLARLAGCDLLFVPGGSYGGGFRPFVTMSQNLLPFQWSEADRYGFSWMLLKLLGLRWSQTRTFRRADGVIFLTEYARDAVTQITKPLNGLTTIVPHGVNADFDCPPRAQRKLAEYSTQKPIRILYVSIVTVYKHQWHVAEAIAGLRKKGLPVQLDLIGSAYPPALNRLQRSIKQLDPAGEFIHYRGSVPYSELPQEYKNSDIFVFASSCENMPNILIEAMKAGLPIACSAKGPMLEVLSEGGVYFDPEKPLEIASAIEALLEDTDLRQQKACGAYQRVQLFTWEQCAQKTLDFIAQVGHQHNAS
jgi:glycosyltransferase involved in cell wall biosynthesis